MIVTLLDFQGAKKVDPKGGKKAAPAKSKKEGSGGGKAKKKVCQLLSFNYMLLVTGKLHCLHTKKNSRFTFLKRQPFHIFGCNFAFTSIHLLLRRRTPSQSVCCSWVCALLFSSFNTI